MNARGFYGIGVELPKTAVNVGTLWRSAYNLGAAFIFTVGERPYFKQASDTVKAWRHVPLLRFHNADDLIDHLPYGTRLIGVEIDDRAVPLPRFDHPERACYLLGAEDHGLTARTRERCNGFTVIPSRQCLNVAVAGSIVMYDRATRQAQHTAPASVVAAETVAGS